MRKLTLELDSLCVQSFAPADEAADFGGTVFGRAEAAPEPWPVGTGPNDTHCSAIDACPSSLGCTFACPIDTRQPKDDDITA